MDNRIIVLVDKTVVKIRGVKIKGLRPFELEQTLKNIIKRPVRVIGVTADSIDMDIYGIEPDAILKDEHGIIKAVSTVEGITARDVIKISSAEKSVEVSIENIPKGPFSGCARERWLNIDDKERGDNTDGK